MESVRNRFAPRTRVMEPWPVQREKNCQRRKRLKKGQVAFVEEVEVHLPAKGDRERVFKDGLTMHLFC